MRFGMLEMWVIQQFWKSCPKESRYAGYLEILMIKRFKVAMTHIGGLPPRYANGVKTRLKSQNAQLFVCGHSHICRVEFDREINCLYMNPGAVGQHGFHQMRTLLLFELDAGKITNLRVVELGKRGKITAG